MTGLNSYHCPYIKLRSDNRAKILIAEDERDIRDLIIFTLRFSGYEVVAASNSFSPRPDRLAAGKECRRTSTRSS